MGCHNPDVRAVGQGCPFKDYVQGHEADHGKYVDAAAQLSIAAKTDYMPKAADPEPFVITFRAGGSR